MSIGIGINVDAAKVKEARREVSFLNDSLKKTEDLGDDLSIGGDNLDKTADLVRKLGESMRSLRSIAGAGEKQGGLLRPEQFVQAEKLSKGIRENFKSLAGDLSKARQELNKLVAERDRLNKVGSSGKYESPTDFMSRHSRIQEIEGQIAAQEANLSRFDKYRAKAGQYGRMAGEAGDAIGGFGQVGGPGMMGKLGKRMIGGGAALLAGVSVMSLVKDAYEQGKTFQPAAADLVMRGGGDVRKNAGTLGYLPMEHMHLLDSMNRNLGLTGGGLDDAGTSVKQFSRGFGLSPEITTGALASAVQAVGFTTAETVGKHLTRIQGAAVQGGVGGRIEEFLGLNSQLLSRLAQGAGGQELTGGQLDWITGLQAALWSRPGMAGKGESGAGFLSAMDQGLRQGGNSPGEQLFFFRAAERAMGQPIRSAEDYERYLNMQDQGIQNKEYFRSSLELARDTFGANEKGGLSTIGRLSVRKMFGLKDVQVQMASEMLERGLFDEQNYKKFLAGEGLANRADLAMTLPGNRTRGIEAGIADQKLGVGEPMVEIMTTAKGALLDLTEAVQGAARRAEEFLRPEMSPEQERRMSVMGVGGGYSPYKRDTEAEVHATLAPEWAQGLADEVRALRELTERQEGQVRRVEVINQPLIHPGFPKGSDR